MAVTLLNPGGCDDDCYECGDACVYCTDYDQDWDVTLADLICSELDYSTAGPGLTASGQRRWGYVTLPTLDSVLNAVHTIPMAEQPGFSTCLNTVFSNCITAVGSITIDVDGTLYLSTIVSSVAAKPAAGDFTGYPFTVTLEIVLIIYDYCGERYAGVQVQTSALDYDDTDVDMNIEGGTVFLQMDPGERVACGDGALVGDDEWSGLPASLGGYAIRGYKKSDSTPNTWRAGGVWLRSIKAATGSAGSSFSASP